MSQLSVKKRESLTNWGTLFKRALCALIYRGHSFPRTLESWDQWGPFKYNKQYRQTLGKRSDLRCLRCDEMFFTKKNYKKGKGKR